MISPETAMKRVQLEFSMLEVLMIQGNLALALRHPGNQGYSRPYVLNILAILTRLLKTEGALSEEEMLWMIEDEMAQGCSDVAAIYRRLR